MRRTWSLYLLRRADGALYTGIALDVAKRLADHEGGRGARSLRGRGPLALVFTTRVGTHGAALRLEARIKRLKKADKERILLAGLPRSLVPRARPMPKKAAKAKSTAKRKVTAKRKTTAKPATRAKPARKTTAESAPVLLSGGNPQIGKADGDAPVQAYIAAMPGWKGEVGRRLDALVERVVPQVKKAVRWNTPFYGVEGAGWFLAYHCITRYVKVSFFRGTSLAPMPPVASKQAEVRYLHIHEGEAIDEALVASWIAQAAALPGANCF
ncbi:MAG: DUF1801 domain-containing protein [Planctomycetes bacterium]|nr:DUF1801 domain-containing protein [Planctomycetota bacterium]